MNAVKLQKIYIDSILSKDPSEDDKYYNYFDGNNYLHILKSKLNHQELLLLDSLTSKQTTKSVWHTFITDKSAPIPDNNYSIQCIHFEVKKLKDNQKQWLNSFKSYFDNVYDAFYLNDNYGVVLLEAINHDLIELEGFVSMLDDDFSTTSTIFIGINSNIDHIQDVFLEEQQLFKLQTKSGQVINYIDTYLSYYIAPKLDDSYIGRQLKQVIHNDQDLIKLIHALWESQGNLTVTAKKLFIHRNTLNYRIDRILKDYAIDLKDTQQLLLCYLLII